MNRLYILNKEYSHISKYSNMKIKYDFSSLRGWIQFFEIILHIAYKKETGKCQARSMENKENL